MTVSINRKVGAGTSNTDPASAIIAGMSSDHSALLGAPNIPLGNQPFAGYIAMIPGAQPANSGSAKSIAGNPLAEAYPAALVARGSLTDAQLWANAGYMSTVNAAGGQFEIALGAYAPNLAAGQCQLLAFTINAPVPAVTSGVVTQGDGASGVQGFSLRALVTTGKLNLAYISSAGTKVPIPSSVATVCDSTDHAGMLVIHASGYCCLWIDGEIDTVSSVNPANFALGTTTPTAPLTFGSVATVGSNGNTAMAAKFKGIHVIKFDTMPLNLNQIAKKLKADPMTPLRNSDVVLASKTVALYWAPAQSNCSGSGNTPGIVGPLGVPDRDTVAAGASGQTRSIISGLAKLLATRGVAAMWGRSAQGSTAATDSWCGRIRTWVTNSNVLAGSYMVNAGVLWKCINTLGFGATSTVAPAEGTGADTVTWTSLGAPTAEDLSVLAGIGVYAYTSARFDPNGLNAAGDARAAAMVSTCSEIVAIASVGQSDRTVGASRAAYSYALQQGAAYHLSRHATKYMICMTVRSDTTANWASFNGGGAANADNDTSNHWYDRHLLPGRLDALAALKGDSRVVAGWDWATDIGLVTIQSSPTGIGVKSDGLHMTDATYESLAVPLANAALISIGI